jgi:predicted RNA-binding Zn ribbon-like protein
MPYSGFVQYRSPDGLVDLDDGASDPLPFGGAGATSFASFEGRPTMKRSPELGLGQVRPRPPGRNREPGGRAAAPDSLRLVQRFINTLDIEDSEDELATPPHLQQWLISQKLIDDAPVTQASHRKVLTFREALRDVLGGHNGAAIPPAALATVQSNCDAANLTFTMDRGGSLRPAPRSGGIDGAIGQILCTIADAERDGIWSRLRACKAHDCRWAFYDYSKPGRSIWCSTAICGTRDKVRRFRAKSRGKDR